MSVRFIHLRRRDPFFGHLEPTGGITVAYDVAPDNTVSYAFAQCSNKDHYCKAAGRAESTKRLTINNRDPKRYKGHIVRSFTRVDGVNIVEQIIKHHDTLPE
jgi:hypothetical protein